VSKSNQHIEEYFKQYLDMRQPGFAVLIKGGWGSGKTYFVDQFIRKHCPISGKDDLTDEKKPLPLMISLFGVRSKADIDERIYEATHTFTSKPITQLGFSLLKGAAKIGALVKGGSDVAAAVDTGADLLEIVWKRLTSNSNIILIFDDVERADMDLRELLGAINPFVESQKLHCILIADEDVWDKANQVAEKDDSKMSRLSAVKEKVIGKTFHLQTDPLEVFQKWLASKDSLLGDRARLCLTGRIETLHKVFVSAPKQNFRAMHHTLLDFQRFIGSDEAPILEKRHMEHQEFMDRFVVDFLTIQYWAHIGEIQYDDVGKTTIHERAKAAVENKGRTVDPTNWESIINSLEENGGIFHVVYNSNRSEWENLWKTWFEKNWIELNVICGLVSDSIWFDRHDEYWSEQCLSWRRLNDDDGAKAKRALELALSNKNITNPSMILRFFDTVLWYAIEEALEKSPDQVLQDYIAYVDRLGERLEPLDVDDNSGVVELLCKDKPQEIAFKEHLENAVNQVKETAKGKWATDFLQSLKENPEAAAQQIHSVSSGNPNAILAKVSAKEFIDRFVALDLDIESRIWKALEQRYTVVANYPWLIEELPFVEELRKEGERRYKESPKPLSPSLFRLRYLNQRLDKALVNLRTGASINPSEGIP
jgi:hypothetical protein